MNNNVDWRPEIGTRVLIIGNHPHTGKTGTVSGHDKISWLNDRYSISVRCDDGLNAGVTRKENIKVIK